MKKIVAILITILLFVINADARPMIFSQVKHRMALHAEEGTRMKLILGDKTYDLQSYNLYYTQVENPLVTPPANFFSNNQTNTISVSIRTSKVDQDFMNWILSPTQMGKDGQIIIYDGETNKTIRTITFTEAKAITYSENGNSNNYLVNNVQFTSFSLHYKTISIKF